MAVSKFTLGFWSLYMIHCIVIHISDTTMFKLSTHSKFNGKILKFKHNYFSETFNSLTECLLRCTTDTACQTVFFSEKNYKCIGYTSLLIKSDKLEDTTASFKMFGIHTDCERAGYVSNKVLKTCFKIKGSKQTFFDARQKCKDDGGDLAVLKPNHKVEAVMEMFKEWESSVICWVGVTDQQKEGTWEFIDGQPATYWNYMGLLNNYDAQFVGKQADCGAWVSFQKAVNDYYCGKKQRFICELTNVKLN